MVSFYAFLALQTPKMQIPPAWRDVSGIVGRPGVVNADGSYRININRDDVKFTNDDGMPIPADVGLTTYIAFSGNEQKALAVGDIAMLRPEIDSMIDALRAGGVEVVALHNHMTSENPRLFYMHFQGIGAPNQLARTFRNAIDMMRHRVVTATATNGKPKLDPDALSKILGTKADIKASGVIRFSNPRNNLNVSVEGLRFTPGMGLASWAAFNACECGKTMVMGDTCCTRADLQKAVDAFRKAGISITSIHNHILGGNLEVEFMHYEGEGESLKMAAGIRSVWNVLK